MPTRTHTHTLSKMLRKVVYWAVTKAAEDFQHVKAPWKPQVLSCELINKEWLCTTAPAAEHVKVPLSCELINKEWLRPATTMGTVAGQVVHSYSTTSSPGSTHSGARSPYDAHEQIEYINRLFGAIDDGRLQSGEVTLSQLRADLNLSELEIEEAHAEGMWRVENSIHLGRSALSSDKGLKAFSMLEKLESILGVACDAPSLIVRLINEASLLRDEPAPHQVNNMDGTISVSPVTTTGSDSLQG